MKKLCLFFILFLSYHAYSSETALFRAVVDDIIDGDTIIIKTDGDEKIILELYGIDCPELRQAFGNMAKSFVKENLLNKKIIVEPISTTENNRLTAIVYYKEDSLEEISDTDDKTEIQKINLNQYLIFNGFAWVNQENVENHQNTDWIKTEDYAKQNKNGLWKDKNPIPPWIWTSLNIKDDLIYAAKTNNLAYVEFLLENGNNVNATDEFGYTALMTATDYNNIEIIKFLYDKGALIDTKDNRGMTALIIAVIKDNIEIIKYLLNIYAEVNIKDNYNFTALDYAEAYKNEKIINLLIEYDAKHGIEIE